MIHSQKLMTFSSVSQTKPATKGPAFQVEKALPAHQAAGELAFEKTEPTIATPSTEPAGPKQGCLRSPRVYPASAKDYGLLSLPGFSLPMLHGLRTPRGHNESTGPSALRWLLVQWWTCNVFLLHHVRVQPGESDKTHTFPKLDFPWV